MKNLTTRRLAVSGMIGAAYAVMAIFGSVFGLTFGPIQFRFSEALCVTPFLFPEAASQAVFPLFDLSSGSALSSSTSLLASR